MDRLPSKCYATQPFGLIGRTNSQTKNESCFPGEEQLTGRTWFGSEDSPLDNRLVVWDRTWCGYMVQNFTKRILWPGLCVSLESASRTLIPFRHVDEYFYPNSSDRLMSPPKRGYTWIFHSVVFISFSICWISLVIMQGSILPSNTQLRWFQPILKNVSQIELFPQVGGEH